MNEGETKKGKLESDQDNSTHPSFIYNHYILSIVILVFSLTALFFLFGYYALDIETLTDLSTIKPPMDFGQVGDSFGLLNAYFASLAFGILIITMLLQREEIRLQRLDFEHSLTESKNQTTAFETQIINSYFFSALELFDRVKAEMNLSLDSDKKFPEVFFNALKTRIPTVISQNKYKNKEERESYVTNYETSNLQHAGDNQKETIMNLIGKEYNIENDLNVYSHYLSLIDNTFSVISGNSKIEENEKEKLIFLWFSRISKKEQQLINLALIIDTVSETNKLPNLTNVFERYKLTEKLDRRYQLLKYRN